MPILRSIVYWSRCIALARHPLPSGVGRELRLRPDRRAIVVVMETPFASVAVTVGADVATWEAMDRIDRECEILAIMTRNEMLSMRRRACGQN